LRGLATISPPSSDEGPKAFVTNPFSCNFVSYANAAASWSGWPGGFVWPTSVVVTAAAVTVCVKPVEVLELKLLSPLYLARIKWFPTAKADVVKVATPELLSVELPRVALVSRKVTVPVGVPEPVEVTVAVNVTACPDTDGFGDDMSVVVVPALELPTVCTVLPLLVKKLPSPL
jgi:hypothetical protein